MDVVACPACHEENPSRFRLCGFCGAPLAPPESVLCPSCGEENPGRFRLCGFCGTSLQGAARPPATTAPPVAPPAALGESEVRKPATFIFVDLKGSTALTERIDQEAMSEIKKRYFSVMAAQIEQHGGTIEKYIGDAIMAVFGIPKAHEDDGLRAVRAAHGMQQELVRLNEDFLRRYGVELANRTGVNTGEVVANTDPSANQQLATGDTVNVAARLEQAAPPNEILIGETTYDLVRSHVDVEAVEPLELKGKAERVPAYRLLAIRTPGAEQPSGATDSPLVGREAHMDLLRGALAATVDGAGCRLAVVLGEAGVGKSHLIDAFAAQVGATTTVLRGRCLPYGDGITFWPIAQALRGASGIVEEDPPDVALSKLALPLATVAEGPDILDRTASILGLSPTRYPVSEIFWGARRYLEALAAGRPVVIVIEDIHYAETTFLELLEHLRDTTAPTAPLLVIASARLDLLDERPTWGSDERNTLVAMAPLGPEDTGRLIEAFLGGQVADPVRSRLVGSTAGNPLFVSQLVSMLVDKGALRREDDLWVADGDLDALAVPPTIQALLASRLDDLSRAERVVLEPASVIGLSFPQAAITELVPTAVQAAVPRHLESLDRKHLVGRDASPGSTDDELYRFRNLLIRDATYGSLLKRARAQTHERFVTWAERINRERGREQEFEEILGYHLEQAYGYRTELGPLDDEGRAIGQRAAEKLAAAGRRAFARGDLPAAGSLLRRASALLDPLDPGRLAMRVDLGEVLFEAGEFGEGVEVLDAVHQAAMDLGDARLTSRARLARLSIAFYAEDEPAGSAAAALEEAEAARRMFEEVGDDVGQARAWSLIVAIHGTSGQLESAAQAAERIVQIATRAGDRRLASRAAAGYATIALAGPQPTTEIIDRCEHLLEQVSGDRKAEATILAVLAVGEAMQQRFDRARELHGRSRAILSELGRSVTAVSTSIEGSRIEILAGDPARAEALLREDDTALEGMGERYFRSTVAGLLAQALEAQGRWDDALAAASLTEELADEDDTTSQVLWRLARAKVLAARNAPDSVEEAVALMDACLAMVGATVDIDLQGDVELDYGEVMLRLGRTEEAAVHFRAAAGRYLSKGDLASEAIARRRLEAAGTGS